MIRSTAGRSQNLTAATVEPRPIQLDLMTQLQYVALQRHVDALDRLVLLFQNLHRARKRFSLHRIITSNTKSSKRPPAPESKAENIAVPQPPARSSMNCGILEMQKTRPNMHTFMPILHGHEWESDKIEGLIGF